jgi:ABC-type cobalamin/Fe3+-siderophores transport system ATPase subunit
MEEIDQNPVWLSTHRLVLGYPSRVVTPQPLELRLSVPGIVALLGRNGAGKTTFLRSFLDRSVVISGSVALFGRTQDQATRLAFVPQEPLYPPHLQLRDCLSLAFLSEWSWFGKITAAQNEEVDRQLELFQMAPLARRPLGTLSPGERQRAFLARAFLQRPEILLLDEPTNHLDPEAKYFFWQALQSAVSLNNTRVLCSTHDLEFARRKASWICGFQNGVLAFSARSKDFWNLETIAEIYGEGPAREWVKNGNA